MEASDSKGTENKDEFNKLKYKVGNQQNSKEFNNENIVRGLWESSKRKAVSLTGITKRKEQCSNLKNPENVPKVRKETDLQI